MFITRDVTSVLDLCLSELRTSIDLRVSGLCGAHKV